jgi:cytochrome c oxidase subunit 1
MPRRVYTYPAGMGWEVLNMTASVGAAIILSALLVDLWNVIAALRTARSASDNPWGAPSLEWATTSPPPAYNFHPLPCVAAREPLWAEPPEYVIVGVRSDHRSMLLTTVIDADLDHISDSPEPTVWPFWSAVGVTALFIGSVFTPWAVVWFAGPVAIAMTKWFWPKWQEQKKDRPPVPGNVEAGEKDKAA